MKANRPFQLAALCLLLASALTMTGCKGDTPAASTSRPSQSDSEPRPVKTARVAEIPMEQAVTVTGTLAAYDQATISAKVPGRIRSIVVDLGSVVRKGDVVAQLEPRDSQLRLQQAEAALAQARARLGLSPEGTDDRVNPEQTGTVRQARAVLDEARLNRDRSLQLIKQGVIAQSQLDAAEAAFKVAESKYQDAIEEIRDRQAVLLQRKSELELARQLLSDLSIRASFEGIVQEKQASLGEYLATGSPVITVVRMNPLRLRAEVPERESRRVRVGQQVRVSVEGDSNIYLGRIARISPTITDQNRVLMVEAEVANNGQLRPGSFARAGIVTDAGTAALAVPVSAIITFAGIEKVLVINDGKTVEKPITTGRRTEEWVEVLSGVNVGETIVVNPGNLQSGQPVTLIE